MDENSLKDFEGYLANAIEEFLDTTEDRGYIREVGKYDEIAYTFTVGDETFVVTVEKQ